MTSVLSSRQWSRISRTSRKARPTISGTYLLDASQSKAPLARADFYCGIYNSPDRVGFSIPNLPPGRYAVVIQKVNGKDPITLSLVLQDVGGAWKLAGYYPRLDAIGGHDGDWYLTKAREFKAKGDVHDAWFYYLTAWDLTAPVNFMGTPAARQDRHRDAECAAQRHAERQFSVEHLGQWQSRLR